MSWHSIFVFAAISGFIFVGLGAFGAHGLSKVLDAKQMSWLQTGLQYQSLHTVVMLGVGILLIQYDNRWLRLSGLFFALGILLFSGSLYILATLSIKVWPYITPLGGLGLLAGWILLLIGVLALKIKGTDCE